MPPPLPPPEKKKKNQENFESSVFTDVTSLKIIQVCALLMLCFFHGTMYWRAGSCAECMLIMQSNSFTSMFIYDQDQTDMSSPAVCCESVLETRPSCVWNGLQRKSFKVKLEGRVHWEWLTNFLCFQVQPDSGRIEHEGNRRFHKSSIRKSTQVELHSRLACASKGAANIVTGSTDHRKVCTVLSVLLCSTYPN